MSLPTLTPASTLSAVVLPITGTAGNINSTVPYKIYSSTTSPLYSKQFLSGAVDQVSYVYKKLGGDVLDIELTEGNIYAAYEEAVLEYSYLINIHQATNILSDALGNTTGSFDSKGNIVAGTQDYNLQTIIEAGVHSDSINGKTVLIKKVFYKTPHAMWRFYGYYGGLNVVGNMHNYGQFSDDSSFQLIPAWQNKQQSMAF